AGTDTRLSRDGGAGGPGSDGGGIGSRRDTGPCVMETEGTLETCSDGIDNDCDFQWDCSDVDCSGVGSCPLCGHVDTPLGAPLALPDGIGDLECTSDADCPGEQRCFEIDSLFGTTRECRESYRSTLSFIGF